MEKHGGEGREDTLNRMRKGEFHSTEQEQEQEQERRGGLERSMRNRGRSRSSRTGGGGERKKMDSGDAYIGREVAGTRHSHSSRHTEQQIWHSLTSR